ncbi:MAG TPA: hypothetical protein VM491_04025, partial [Burkholderiaceae bacterium]|nr:hypothetical protein [Burkholderiaceae bacterium]
MRSAALPDFPLGDGPVSALLRDAGVDRFSQACVFVASLPYGRPPPPRDPQAILSSRRGTCSDKHLLLARLAREAARDDLRLAVLIYLMNERNTPGVGMVLAAHGLDEIPEAHCVLAFRGVHHDFTGLPAGAQSPLESVLLERSVEPDRLHATKARIHGDALQRWCSSRGVDENRAWQAREACISALSARGPA